MASACINNLALSRERFLDRPTSFSSFGWFSPRISRGRDEQASISSSVKPAPHSPQKNVDTTEIIELDYEGLEKDFEFQIEDPVIMLPADELFSDGKLMPLQLSAFQQAESSSEARLLDTAKVHQSCELDPYLFSPRAPRCATRWKELLGLKRVYQNNAKQDNQKMMPSGITNNKSLKHLLHRCSKSTPIDSSPLLRDRDEVVSIPSRLSLSSLSSGHDDAEIPRLSLHSERHTALNKNSTRIRLVKNTQGKISTSPMVDNKTVTLLGRGVSLDSPRMNSSGKIVFQSLERSSSSPGSFNGGPRWQHRGVERSHSANVRLVTPVLNVPVCSKSGSVFGFPLFSAPSHKRECGAGCSNLSRTSRLAAAAARTKRIDPEQMYKQDTLEMFGIGS